MAPLLALSARHMQPQAYVVQSPGETAMHAHRLNPNAVYGEVRPQFEGKTLADLTTLIGMINLRNRLAISLRYEHPTDAAA
jgi:alkylhydroperoxidase family enzyme